MQQKAQTPIQLWRREGEREETEMIKIERKGRGRRGDSDEGGEGVKMGREGDSVGGGGSRERKGERCWKVERRERRVWPLLCG